MYLFTRGWGQCIVILAEPQGFLMLRMLPTNTILHTSIPVSDAGRNFSGHKEWCLYSFDTRCWPPQCQTPLSKSAIPSVKALFADNNNGPTCPLQTPKKFGLKINTKQETDWSAETTKHFRNQGGGHYDRWNNGNNLTLCKNSPALEAQLQKTDEQMLRYRRENRTVIRYASKYF